jgi:hypothetical protein
MSVYNPMDPDFAFTLGIEAFTYRVFGAFRVRCQGF